MIFLFTLSPFRVVRYGHLPLKAERARKINQELVMMQRIWNTHSHTHTNTRTYIHIANLLGFIETATPKHKTNERKTEKKTNKYKTNIRPKQNHKYQRQPNERRIRQRNIFLCYVTWNEFDVIKKMCARPTNAQTSASFHSYALSMGFKYVI